jgi:hypothetical protein
LGKLFFFFFLSKFINVQYMLVPDRVISSKFNETGPAWPTAVVPALSISANTVAASAFGHHSGQNSGDGGGISNENDVY